MLKCRSGLIFYCWLILKEKKFLLRQKQHNKTSKSLIINPKQDLQQANTNKFPKVEFIKTAIANKIIAYIYCNYE
ncbi:hypothetical protein CRP01_16745 [Flavilitoribacter nigricans DSM 23189 = NBRC 102662]|uniref:Uncharacterized protein n=1 Tax=Flavilitoribacter nigricans (strain ATCC 23147 / DSM 23189 / NBRC 102662 / NCIMB 1420 / SS-2) TaxID=1122177 RepID=A0A2D0N9V0_FLAN2|nr:hypothetical protein CRP01_16745 [Flavilitoribacter nigricans DSM 23189 = NBRC 102662]